MEGYDPSHVNMGMGDGSELSDGPVRKLIRFLIPDALYVMRIPGHDMAVDTRTFRISAMQPHPRPLFRPTFNVSGFSLSTYVNGQ